MRVPAGARTCTRMPQKTLLAKPALSVTDIGMTIGFSETSSFTAAFRKATGFTPSAYHRSLV